MKNIQIRGVVYEEILPFSEGLAAVKLNGEWGYCDKRWLIVIFFRFTEASPFKGGKANVAIEKDVFWIDKHGVETDPPFKRKKETKKSGGGISRPTL